MNLSIGIVGLPNVGKSTLFNSLLKQQAALAANYPFATIEPNVGIVPVPDARLEKLAELVKTQIIKPATVEFVDIAGLVAGAAQGEGLGNKFLANIRETAAIVHVIRAFEDGDIVKEGSVDPVEDLAVIRTELQLADLATLQKQPEPKASKDKLALEKWQAIQQLSTIVEAGKTISNEVEQDSKTADVAEELCLLTAKPELFVVNVSEDALGKPYQDLVATYAEKLAVKPEQVIVISAKIESELASLSDEDQALYLADLGLETSGLERLISAAYTTLNLQSFLTAGEKEVKAWTIPAGTKAPQAAGTIHTDFEKKFIKAHVVSYSDFVSFGGWKQAREAGKARLEGKDYVMQPDDVVEFAVGG